MSTSFRVEIKHEGRARTFIVKALTADKTKTYVRRYLEMTTDDSSEFEITAVSAVSNKLTSQYQLGFGGIYEE